MSQVSQVFSFIMTNYIVSFYLLQKISLSLS